MNIIKNMSIRSKLILISLIPVGALLYYLTGSIRDDLKDKADINKVYTGVLVAEDISNIIQELQLERGYSYRFYNHPRYYTQSEVTNQRIEVDKALSHFNIMIQEDTNLVDFNISEQVIFIRNHIDNKEYDGDETYVAYRNLIVRLIGTVNNISHNTRDIEIKELLGNYLDLLNAEEFMGRIRSRLNENITDGGFEDYSLTQFASISGKYENCLDDFLLYAPKNISSQFEQKSSNPAVLNTKKAMDIAMNDPSLKSFPFTADEWWVNSTGYINILVEILEFTRLNIIETAQVKIIKSGNSIRRNVVIGLIIVLVIIFLILYISFLIVSSITKIKLTADCISTGETNIPINITSRDEIGDLAASFRQLINVTRDFAGIAERIGKGDYSPEIPVRGENDTLGKALHTMKVNLGKLSEENAARTWVLTGNSELNDRLRGEKDIKLLAQDVINHLTPYLGAQIGAIYLSDGNHLALAGSYAFHRRKENSNIIEFGQGLIGQAALEKKPIIFSRVPDDYIQINSALGSSVPKNIIVYPFFYEEEVKGVIEIGSVNEFTDLQKQLLDLVAENIGIAFNSSESRIRLKELLEETQKQAEELENQQEELRQANEELEEKTDLLEKSEAELKAQQEELQSTNEELEEKANLLEEQKEKLEVSKMEVEIKARELEITSKYKSEFLANMSHELRTPLNSILILAQLLVENKTETLTGKEIEFAQNIYSSGKDLLSLINEILDLSKVEAGKIELEIGELSFDDLIQSLKSMFNEVARKKSINFNINFDQDKKWKPVFTDKLRIEQILRNLLSNAFKFTDKGGEVSVTFDRVKPGNEIKSEKLKHNKELFYIAIKDNGIGISQEKQALVFEAFQQADGSTKRKYGGTGLGLSISRELAYALGGEIHLQSAEGEGSTFTLYLPVKFDESNIQVVEKNVEVKVPKKEMSAKRAPVEENVEEIIWDIEDDRFSIRENDKVVLILEDDDTFAKMLLNFVRERGYKGIVAYFGNSGLSLARHYKPDAVILDMKLPVMDGSEVLKHLKNDPELRHIPVQIISGYDRRKEGLDLGAFDFLRKPVDIKDLQSVFDRIEEFINKSLKKLLIVEDNKEQNKAIKELIGNHDVSSFAAYSGKEALEIIKKEKFDCIIIDLGLPDMSGFELLEIMQKERDLQQTPIIVYTGKDLSKQEVSKLEKLANTVVLKTAESTERLLDETTLFLHRVESNLSKEKQNIIRKLHRTDEVLKNKKVLIVDDDMRNIFSVTNVLDSEGMNCITAENGVEAIKLLKKNPDTDIILMDIMMPEMDGYDATREIRKLDKFHKIPIIALTAKAMKGDHEKCLQVGMSDYVAKPVNIDKLLSLMRVWLYK